MTKKVYELDGNNFATLEEFFDEISRVLIPGASWGHNLDAFNDILSGGFIPENRFVLLWKHSQLSRKWLGYPETVRQLELKLARCHPSNREQVRAELQDARNNEGPTVFDWLVEVIQTHCPCGDEVHDGVDLILD